METSIVLARRKAFGIGHSLNVGAALVPGSAAAAAVVFASAEREHGAAADGPDVGSEAVEHLAVAAEEGGEGWHAAAYDGDVDFNDTFAHVC